MAQTIDIPEPKQDTAPSSPNMSADDLLSQLAGDEIDKLLAEAEMEKPASAVSDPSPTTIDADPQTLSSVASEAEAPVEAVVAESAPPPPTKQEAAEAAVSAELDELFKELSGDPKPPVSAPAPVAAPAPVTVPTPVPAPVVATPAPVAAPAAHVAEQPTSNQERAALDAPAPEVQSHGEHDEAPGVPIYLKPLEWLSLPLKFVPEGSRDLVGKVAIVSFMNAVSVMVYLLIFHRR